MRPKKLVLYGVALAMLAALGLWMRDAVRVDRCLDHGGRRDYEDRACGGERRSARSVPL
jgi:hypothetical protein